MSTSYTAFFGDAQRTFNLSSLMIIELEAKVDSGIGALFQRVVSNTFRHVDLTETVRCALIGGGTSPAEAARLVSVYVADRPLAEALSLVLGILDATWNGTPAAPLPPREGRILLDMDAVIAADAAEEAAS